jgi:dGTPase
MSSNSEKIDIDLVQFAAIAHDLGHPPFGHNGEHALDQLMRNYGGYEGNAQTLRILSCVEKKLVMNDGEYSDAFGLNLTYRSLASILKYDEKIPSVRRNDTAPKKGYYAANIGLVEKIKSHVAPEYDGKFKTIECAIMDIADDIAYSTYDLEDALHAGFVTSSRIVAALFERSRTEADVQVVDEVLRKINKALKLFKYHRIKAQGELLWYAAKIFDLNVPPIDNFYKIKTNAKNVENQEELNIVLRLASHRYEQGLVTTPVARTAFTAGRVGDLINSVVFELDERYPQMSKVKLSRDALIEVELLKHINYELNILSPRLAVIEYRGKKIVKQIFEAYIESEGKLLPEEWQEDYYKAKHKGIADTYRVVCDYVASLTDIHAAELHSRLFADGQSIFKPL